MLSAFLLGVLATGQTTLPTPQVPAPPSPSRREQEWRKITDAEPTSLIADLNLALPLPRVPDGYRGRWRYEALAVAAERDLVWVDGVAVLAVRPVAAQVSTNQRREFAEWLASLGPGEVARLRKGETRVLDLPENVRRNVLANLPGEAGGSALAARVEVEPALAFRFANSGGERIATTQTLGGSDGMRLAPTPAVRPAPFAPPVVPLPEAPRGRLTFSEGKAMTVRELTEAAGRAFSRVGYVDERIADRTVFVRGTFSAPALERALARLSPVPAILWKEAERTESERAPDLVGGALGELWKGRRLPSGVTLDRLRKGFDLSPDQLGGFSVPRHRGAPAGPVNVRAGFEFRVVTDGSGVFAFDAL